MERSLARIEPEILKAIWDKAKKENPKITRNAIYKRIQAVEKEFGKAISPRMAANILASRMRINVYRILKDEDELKELRDLAKSTPSQIVITTSKEERATKEMQIVVSNKIVETFGLPQNLSTEANRMADIYPMMYVLENLVRYVAMDVLANAYGLDWWNQPNVVSNNVKREVEKRKRQEGANRWHYKRGGHEIFYTNFGDLSAIISTNWGHFKPLFSKLTWIQAKLEEVELSRNIIAHNNPLPKREFDRIKMCLEDLQRQLSVYVEKKDKR